MIEEHYPQPLAQAVQTRPDELALICDDRHFSFAQLQHTVNWLCQQLLEQGLKRQEHLMAVAENSLELLCLHLACLQMELLFCPVSPRFSPAEIAALSQKLECRWLWQADKTAPLLSGQQQAVQINLQEPAPSLLPLPSQMINSQRPCNIILSSGSSGLPKAVVHNYGNHYASAIGAQRLIELSPGDRCLLSLPIYHIGGFAIVMRSLLAGATMVLSSQANLARTIATQKISHLSLVATQLWRLLTNAELKLNSIKACIVGGGPVSPELIAEAKRRHLPCFISYGLSEMSSQVATAVANAGQVCGLALPGRQLRLVGHHGEIAVKGEVLAMAYYNQGMSPLPVDKAGWFHTGDLGQLSSQGLKVIGRLSNMLISGGENIHPEEIERQLLRFDCIAAAVVVAQDDIEFGQRPVAIIEWQVPCEHMLTLEQIRQELSQKMAKFKVPDLFLFWPQYLKPVALKPQRAQLQQFMDDWLNKRLVNPLEQLQGLAKLSATGLQEIGIYTKNDLSQLGAVLSFIRLSQLRKQQAKPKPSLNLLYALVGAIEDRPWLEVAKTERERLLIELEAYRELAD